MTRRLLIPLALACISAAPPAAPKAQPAALTITRDERAMLLGYAARIEAAQLRVELVQLRAQRDVEAAEAERRECLGQVAARLGIPADRLASDYVVNSDTLAVEPRRPSGAK